MNLLDLQFVEACRTPSDIYLHLPRMVELVHKLNAQHVLELGSRSGVSTIAWLQALQRTGGRLTSVDLDSAPAIGTHDNWTHIQGDDCSPAIIDQLEPADIVFIDTSHWYRHTVQELAIYRWMVKPGGAICMHDTELPWPEGSQPGDPRFPVKRALNEFLAETGWEHINYPDCWGFAIVKVPKE